ncbi:ataxin-1-like [Chanos chanos]|uniref:Ataxin-1-like n=1 Tax=Chanos chanos TaxID=29144 RepID=A0A6J2UNG8_CHACN|nr:ataxin-1-like [Chanos chanos]
MKPAHERNQECLPPKKRDLPVNNISSSSSTGGSGVGGGGGGAGGGEEAPSTQSPGAGGEPQGGGNSSEWMRAQSGLRYIEGSDSLQGLPVDQYSMLYKVAVPSVTYSPTSLHPVLSHISPAYTVPSPLLQHTGIPYPPVGYAQIPHSSLQFISSPYAAVPYAVPPGFVPSPLISPQSAIPQPHPVSHLVPYPSVIQEGVVSSPPQPQVSAHAYAKVAAPAGVPIVLPSEQAAAQQQLGTVGMLPAAELSPRGVPVYYHPSGGARATPHSGSLEQEREVNGGEREQGGREPLQDAIYMARNTRVLQTAPGAATLETQQDRSLRNRRQDGRVSPGQRSTPDTDLEVQQVVGRLASPVHSVSGSRKDAPHGPLNLSQGSQRDREAHGENRAAFVSHSLGPMESRAQPPQQTVQSGHHAVILANGQPVLVPLDYQHQQQQVQHYPSQPNDAASAATMASPTSYSKASDAAASVCLPERAVVELAPQQSHQPSQQAGVPATPAVLPAVPMAPAASGPSHFMKGAIIQLATGELKRVEDLQTQDFVRSAEVSGGLKIDSSMVVDIRASHQRPGLVALHFTVGEQQSKVTIDVPPEHPFFVFGQGWSSCSPERSAQLYGLTCHHLQVGDVCVSITLQQQGQPQQKIQQQQQQQQQHQVQARTSTKANSTSGAISQPMGPPAPQHSRPQGHFKMDRIHRERDRDRERGDKEEPMQLVATGHGDVPPRPNRTSAEHTRSQSSYYLHTEGQSRSGMGGASSSLGTSQRRWSAPGFQRYAIKSEDGSRASAATAGSSRSFIPQEVKLSIEGRSNAGK